MFSEPVRGELIYGDEIYQCDEDMEELWQETEYPGYYISNHGRLWSSKTNRFMKERKGDREGHIAYVISHNKRPKYEYAHRLVAKGFIENPDNKPLVRHLDDCKDYNWVENLAWGTKSDNARDSIENGLAYIPTEADRRIGLEKLRVPVEATNLNTGEKSYHWSQGQAGSDLGVLQQNINKVVKGKRKSAGGYSFRAISKEEYNERHYQ